MLPARTISFVIPVRNDATRLRRCLQSIAANRTVGTEVQVIVADNGSTDGSAQVALDAGADVMVLPNVAVAELRNAAVARATGAVVAFVDADHEIGQDWITSALDGLAANEAVGIGALCHAPAGGTWVQRTYDRLRTRPARLSEVEWLGAGNLAVRTESFREVGGFDTTLETCEDVDLCNRLRARGGRLISEPKMYNVHFGDPASLRALFHGELWRGRDNIRVTLRGPLTVRSIPSLMLPVVVLTSIPAGLLMAAVARLAWWLLLPLTTLGASALLRTFRMTTRGLGSPVRLLAENLAVSIVYESARAAALVARASHSVRRGEEKDA